MSITVSGHSDPSKVLTPATPATKETAPVKTIETDYANKAVNRQETIKKIVQDCAVSGLGGQQLACYKVGSPQVTSADGNVGKPPVAKPEAKEEKGSDGITVKAEDGGKDEFAPLDRTVEELKSEIDPFLQFSNGKSYSEHATEDFASTANYQHWDGEKLEAELMKFVDGQTAADGVDEFAAHWAEES